MEIQTRVLSEGFSADMEISAEIWNRNIKPNYLWIGYTYTVEVKL